MATEAETPSLGAALRGDLDHEMAGTRRVLEALPEERLDWRPHPKSGTMGWVASHLANLPRFVPAVLETDSVDLAEGSPGGLLSTRRELLETFDGNVAAARAALAGVSEERLLQPWTLRNGQQVLFTLPRLNVVRTFMLHHIIHHRAQLALYLRLNDIPVPGLYGPSADEGGE